MSLNIFLIFNLLFFLIASGSVQNDSEAIVSRVSVPPQLVPVLFGPGGTKLDEIKRLSTCGIVIGGSVSKTGDSIITIKGTKRNIAHAQYLLQTAVRESGMWKD